MTLFCTHLYSRFRFSRTLLMVVLAVALCSVASAQAPTQIKQILPSRPSLDIGWDYNTADESKIDSFILQRTAFAPGALITDPYNVEIIINEKTARLYTWAVPAGLVPGQKVFFRMIARKQGLADSEPSNVVEVDVVGVPPSPTNFRFP